MSGDEVKKTFNLDGTHQQLLDINKDTKNFVAEFKITPNILDYEVPYSVAVVTQADLDNQGTIDFKQMTRAFSGTVKNVDGDGQNYFLAIKSEKPMKGLVFSLKLTDIVQQEQQQQSIQQPQSTQSISGDQIRQAMQEQAMEALARQQEVKESYSTPRKSNGKLVKYVLSFFTVVAAGFLIYYFWKTSKNKDAKPNEESD